MNPFLLLFSITLAISGPSDAEWQVRCVGPRLVVRAELPEEQEGGSVARLVPMDGTELPGMEILDTDVEGKATGEWAKFGEPVCAGGVELVPLVVARELDDGAGRTARLGSIELELTYRQPPEPEQAEGVMARMMTGLCTGEEPEYRLDQPGYLIIVPDDFYDNIMPLARWKERRGFVVWVRKLSETGSQREDIRDFIVGAYEAWDPVPSYVLLVGAVNKIPAYITTGTPCVTDHPYACTDGDDFLADLFVGRLPAANASELDVMVAKTIGYEKTPYVAETDWYHQALMIGTSYQEGGTPAVTALITKRLIRERLFDRGFSRIDTVFYPPTRYGQGPVDSTVNRGVSFINGRGWGNYDGWGYPQFLTNDVYGLQNGWKLPIVTSIYCGTGNYARNPCFGEAWLRAGSPSNPKGAVAFWGSSWTATSTRWNNCMDYGIYRAVFDWNVLACGPAMYLGKMAQFENFPTPADSEHLRLYFHVYNLLGDPSLDMRTRVPQSVDVTYPEAYPRGTSSFDVRVLKAGTAEPFEGALVCLRDSGRVHETARTNAQGWARFAVRPSDSLQVTVAGGNLGSYVGTSLASDRQVFVGRNSHTPMTAAAGSSVSLSVELKNFGIGQTAQSVECLLRATDSFATVTDSFRSYGDIAAGGTANAVPYALTISPACTSGQRVKLDLYVSSGDSTWQGALDLAVIGPTFRVLDYVVHDGNGYLDPGETAEVSATVLNYGDGGASGVQGVLQALDPAIVVLDSSGSFGAIGAGDSADNSAERFQVQARAGIGIGRRFTVRLRLTGTEGFEHSCDFDITVGEPVSSAPLGPDYYGYYAYDDTDVGYEETPTYEWIEIDPAHGGQGTDVGIENDTAVTAALPFTFKFYGRDYDEVSISDNGYVAMGGSWFGEIYNWHIPSANGPDGFVAGFWDDFRCDTLDASGVFTWHDQANHRFVIEWSRCHHVHGYRPPIIAELQTFEVILCDPAFHATVTGDGPVLCQYREVRNDDSLFENGHNFATAGIQSPDHNDGLEYTFAGRYPASAAPIGADRTIWYTTNPPDTFDAIREERPGAGTVNRFSAWPNPVRRALNLELPAEARVQVFDAAGREVVRFPAAGTTRWRLLDSRGLRVRAGVYHVVLTSAADGRTMASKRVLVLGESH